MKRTLKAMALCALAVAALGSCSSTEYDRESTEPAPEAGGGPDPTIVDAGHYKTEFENDRVRILRINYGPGEESVMHHHPDNVGVFLTDLRVQMTMPDGTTDELHATPGEAMFAPGGRHLPKNIGDEVTELVLVELKSGGAPVAGGEGPDPVEVDAKHYTSELENDRVRIVRIKYGAGEESVMHHHPDSVGVFLTDQHVQMTMPDGTTNEVHAKPGEHIFVPGGQHLPKNIGEEPFELVLVELK